MRACLTRKGIFGAASPAGGDCRLDAEIARDRDDKAGSRWRTEIVLTADHLGVEPITQAVGERRWSAWQERDLHARRDRGLTRDEARPSRVRLPGRDRQSGGGADQQSTTHEATHWSAPAMAKAHGD